MSHKRRWPGQGLTPDQISGNLASIRCGRLPAVGLSTMRSRLSAVERWARALKRDVVALWIAARDPRTPWYAKVAAGAVAAYAFSPIDLDPTLSLCSATWTTLVIVPLGIALAQSTSIPPGLMAEYRNEAVKRAGRPRRISWQGSSSGSSGRHLSAPLVLGSDINISAIVDVVLWTFEVLIVENNRRRRSVASRQRKAG